MAQKKVIVECNINVTLDGSDLTVGYARIYRNYPVTVEYKNPKDIGTEAWTWAQSNWDSFVPEEFEFDLGGATVKGERQWVCVIGVTDAKGKALPMLERKLQARVKTQRPKYWDTGAKKKKAQPKPPPKPKTRAEKALEASGVTDDNLNVTAKISDRIKKALA